MDHAVILFDGVCNLCNSFVIFIIKRDKHNYFRFASLQSDLAKKLIGDKALKTIVLIENGKTYERSTAALRIIRRLAGAWPLFYGLIVIPAFLRDMVYDLVAHYRYRWFGQRKECVIPSPELAQKFLDDGVK